jgi:hypothetical protein
MTAKVLDYPPDAFKVTFKPLSGKTMRYRIWSKDGYYYWYACGHSGKEATQEAAMRAAREWINLGVSGLKSHGEIHGVFHAGRG